MEDPLTKEEKLGELESLRQEYASLDNASFWGCWPQTANTASDIHSDIRRLEDELGLPHSLKASWERQNGR